MRAANARSRLAVSSESGGAILARLAIIRRAPLRDSVFVAALRSKRRELLASPETESETDERRQPAKPTSQAERHSLAAPAEREGGCA